MKDRKIKKKKALESQGNAITNNLNINFLVYSSKKIRSKKFKFYSVCRKAEVEAQDALFHSRLRLSQS